MFKFYKNLNFVAYVKSSYLHIREEYLTMSKPKSAQAPTDRYAIEYNMDHVRRGVAIIFYHENFDGREGTLNTTKDCNDLKNCLENLDFNVETYKDLKWAQIKYIIKKAAKDDQRKNDDCIVIAILTHGDDNYLRAKDDLYMLDDIGKCFTADKCPNLAGKPKILFIDAPRGDGLDPGIKVRKTETDGENMNKMNYTIPIHADFLFVHSTIPGFVSRSNTNTGSWFIQSLVAELNKNGKRRNLLTILTFVNRRVALDYESMNPSNPAKDKQKQIPCITSMLTRIVHFNDKVKESKDSNSNLT